MKIGFKKCLWVCFFVISQTQGILSQETNGLWQPILGEHYLPINNAQKNTSEIDNTEDPQPTIQFYFWPGSASCYQLELALLTWQKANPQYPVQRIPLVKRTQWRLLAKAWLVAENMQMSPFFLQQLYATIHLQNKSVNDQKELDQLILALDIDHLKFTSLFNSPAINQQLSLLQRQAEVFSVTKVPTIIIDNRWSSDAPTATTSAQVIQIIDTLITQSLQPTTGYRSLIIHDPNQAVQ